MNCIDLHCDTILRLWGEKGTNLRRNQFSIDVEKLMSGGSLAQFFAVFIDLEQHLHPFAVFKEMADLFFQEIEKNNDVMAFARSASELEANQANRKISAFLTIEEGGALEGSMSNFHEAFQRGVRLITLTWNYPNEVGYPNSEWKHQHEGLTPFGQELVAEMNRCGVLIDVSHLSDQGFYDVAHLSTQPFVASHSNARALTGHSRNLTDDMIKVVAEKGGVIGLNFCADFLGESKRSRVEDMVRHLQYIRQVGGSEVIALGTDFDGIGKDLEIENIGQIDKLAGALASAGMKESDIERFLWKNTLRVIRDVVNA